MTSPVVPVSVVVCTRDRPDDLRRCLKSLAVLDPAPFEVVVIDQSAHPIDASVVLPCVVQHRTPERGASRARNRGLRAARAPIVAFLDDDCVVEPTWAADVAAVFEREPRVGIVFGAVLSAESNDDQYVPAYAIPRERRLKGRAAAATAHGISAAMYIRADVADAIAFDERLGGGADFRSSEDWDYSFRALSRGVEIIETPSVKVFHYGARSYSSGAAATMLRWNAFSHGAVHAKYLRSLDPIAAILIPAELADLLRLIRPLGPLLGRPTNAARLWMYFRGLGAGLRAPMRKSEKLFRGVAATDTV